MICIIFISIFVIPTLFLLKPLIPLIFLKIKLKDKAALRFFPYIGFLFYDFRSQHKYNDPLQWVEILLAESPNVEVILTNFQLKPYIIFGNPQTIQKVLEDSHASRLNCFPLEGFMERGLNFVGGQQWKEQRKQISKSFTYQALQNRIKVIQEITRSSLNSLPLDEALDTIEFGGQIASETIIRTFFGNSFPSCQGEHAGNSIREVVNNLIRIFERPYFVIKYFIFGYKAWQIFPSKFEKQLMDKFVKLREIAIQIIENRILDKQNNKQSWKPKDFLDEFLVVETMTHDKMEEIVQNFFTFFVAGTDTTAHLIMYSIYYLGLYPEIQVNIRREITQICNIQSIDYDLNKFVILSAFLNEVLRMELALNSFTPRIAYKDLNFNGTLIKKDWLFGFSAKLVHSNEKYYKNAKQFDLTRWINNQNQYFFGFSQGPRNCIGQHLGQIEAKIVLIEILRKYQIILLETKLYKQLGTMIDVKNAKFAKLIKI